MVNRGLLFTAVLSLLMALAITESAYAQSPVDSFHPVPSNSVTSIVVRPNGQILIGGTFYEIGTEVRNRLALLNHDGSLDTDFNPDLMSFDVRFGPPGLVNSIINLPDGRFLVAGAFDVISGEERHNAAVFHPDGSLDVSVDFGLRIASPANTVAVLPSGSFLVDSGFAGDEHRYYYYLPNGIWSPDGEGLGHFLWAPNDPTLSMVVQEDGIVLLGGRFTYVGDEPRNHIARIRPNVFYGAWIDESFNPDANDTVETIATQPDGKILIGGWFTAVGGVARNRIARLNPDGSVDAGFNPDADGFVKSILVQPDGKILIGGFFNSIGGATRNYIGRLNPDGSLDESFNPDANSGVSCMALEPDGKILIGGQFHTVGGTERPYIARLYPDGRVEKDFDPGPNSYVEAIAIQKDEKVLVGGSFTKIGDEPVHRIGRIHPDGALDADFNPDANSNVRSIVVQPDDRILIGGDFTAVGGITRNHIARLNPDGSLDPGFDPDANNRIVAIALQRDGKILVGGYFTVIGGISRSYIARLNPDGSLDPDFAPHVYYFVGCIAIQPDGKILIAGFLNATGWGIARLHPDGTVDAGFNCDPDQQISAINVQADGKILIGGMFTNVDGLASRRMARLNTNGSLDLSLYADANDSVDSIVIQADSKIVIGGAFTSLGGVTRNGIARLNLDGSLDESFSADINAGVRSIAVQVDGKILIGGGFTTVGGVTRNGIARLTNTDAAFQELRASSFGPPVAWMRGATSPEVGRVVFEHSIDGITWTVLGDGSRISGGWEFIGEPLPGGQNYYIRALGYASGGYGNASGSLYESVGRFYIKSVGFNRWPRGMDSRPPADRRRSIGRRSIGRSIG